MSVNFEDNSQEIKNLMERKKEQTLETLGQTAEGYAKRLCPVDTGTLRRSISHGTQDGYAVIGTNVEYAPYVELGTRKMQARSFLRKAIEDHANTFRKIIKNIMGDD